MNCPLSYESGCRCPQHHRGLLDFTVSDEHQALLSHALEQLREPETTTLHVLTFDPQPPDNLVVLRPCDGSYTCQCQDCERDRSRRLAQGVRRSHSMPIKIRRAA